MNQSKTRILSVLIVAAILGLGSWAAYDSQTSNPQSQTNPTSNTEAKTPELGRTEITYAATPGITSLEQLKLEVEDVIVIENSEFGDYVDSIEGHKGGTEGKYWSFYVNGEMAQVGASTYIQEEGDQILWKFQKL